MTLPHTRLAAPHDNEGKRVSGRIATFPIAGLDLRLSVPLKDRSLPAQVRKKRGTRRSFQELIAGHRFARLVAGEGPFDAVTALRHGMDNVTRILQKMEQGDSAVAEQLLPLVYDELRRLAARQLRSEPSGNTLQPTALVHEAYVRLVDQDSEPHWNHRGHFYAAAAEAMRRILVESARRKQTLKRGGDRNRVSLDGDQITAPHRHPDLLALDAALEQLTLDRPELARLVSLRYFAGLTMQQAAKALDISLRTAERNWTYARAWLLEAVGDD